MDSHHHQHRYRFVFRRKIQQRPRAFYSQYFFFTTLRAQQDTTLVSLYRLPDDSNKLKKILTLGEALEDKDTIQSYKLYQEALRLSTDLKLYYYQSRTLNNLGILSRKKMDFQSALLYYTKSIAAAERIPDELRVASAQTNIANVLIKLNQLVILMLF